MALELLSATLYVLFTGNFEKQDPIRVALSVVESGVAHEATHLLNSQGLQ